VLRRVKPAKRRRRVLIVDASDLFRKGRAQNFLDPEHAAQIVTWVTAHSKMSLIARKSLRWRTSKPKTVR
jgi:type I restriction-modification system DNA methylase subunit